MTSLSTWANEVGFGIIAPTAQRLGFAFPGRDLPVFFITIRPEQRHPFVVTLNPRNPAAEALRDALEDAFEFEIGLDDRSPPQIHLEQESAELLEGIAAWARSKGLAALKDVVETLQAQADARPEAVQPTPVPLSRTPSTADKPPAPASRDVAPKELDGFDRRLKGFFQARGLTGPDGRPLYAYKTSDDEFGRIEAMLRFLVLRHGSRFLKRDPRTNGMFVLYAAEWWRREFAGGSWSWTPILRAIEVDDTGIEQLRGQIQNLLYPALGLGFHYWRREVFITASGRRYIASLAAEGGLPLKLLAQGEAGLSAFFTRLLDRFLPLRDKGVPASSVASDLRIHLPESFRRDQVYQVAGEIIETTLALRSEYGLKDQADPVAHLNQVCPSWRERFPLTLDHGPAQALLGGLVKQAAEASSTDLPLQLVRYLDTQLDGTLSLAATFEFPKNVSVASLCALFGERDWPAMVHIWVSQPFRKRAATLTRSGDGQYRVRTDGLVWRGLRATDEVGVELYSYEDLLRDELLLPETQLEDEAPWVFTLRDQRPVLVGQGSLRLATDEATVVVPRGASAVGADGPQEVEGELTEPRRAIVTAKGELRIQTGDGDFVIRTQQKSLEVDRYQLTGRRLDFPASVRQVYLGAPELDRYPLEGSPHRLPHDQIRWRHVGTGATWRAWSAGMCGVVEIMASDRDGEVRFRTRVAVLPTATTITLTPGKNASSGRVAIDGMPGVTLSAMAPGITANVASSDEGHHEISLTRDSTEQASFDLAVRWPGSARDLNLVLPMPIRGARFRGADGQWLPDHAVISVTDLAGVHACGFNYPGRVAERYHLTISIVANDLDPEESRILTSTVPLLNSGGTSVLPLIQLRERLLRLFAVSEHLDCQITLRLESDRLFSQLHLARYTKQLSPEGDRFVIESAQHWLSVDQEMIDHITLEAHSLLDPDGQGVLLRPLETQGVRTGTWLVPDNLEPGRYLVMQPVAEGCHVRPAILSINGRIDNGDGRLRDAFAIDDREPRIAAINARLNAMTGDYQDADWPLVFSVLKAFSHLPAVSLTLWECVARDPDALAMFLIKADSRNYQQVIELAAQLPLLWELVPLSSWVNALRQLKRYASQASDEVATMIVRERLGFMAEADPVLGKARRILEAIVLGQVGDEFAQHMALVAAHPSVIARPLHGAVDDLLERHEEGVRWPTLRGTLVHQIEQAAPETLQRLFLNRADYMSSVIHAPLALAAYVCMPDRFSSVSPTHADIYELQSVRQFDDDWFREAFGLTLFYCYSIGLLDELLEA